VCKDTKITACQKPRETINTLPLLTTFIVMHILIIPSWYKSKIHPFRGVFFEEQARALLKRGNQVGVIVPSLLAYDTKEDSSFFQYDDNGLVTFIQSVKPLSRRSNKVNEAYFLFRVYNKAYRQYVKENGTPDIIHSHVYKYGGLLGAYLSKRKSIPHVFTEHFSVWVNPNAVIPPSDIRLMRRVLEQTDQAYTVSSFLKNSIQKKIGNQGFKVLPNMINDLFIQKDESKIKNSVFRLINIGGLVQVKNQKLVLRAFSLFIKKYKIAAELYIIGEGDLRQELIDEVQLLEISDKVQLVGARDREQVKDEIKKSDVGVISSDVETFSIAGIEFMSQGLPVVTTDCGGPIDYIQDFNGIVVRDEIEMAESFYTIYHNYTYYNQDRIKTFIQDHFSEAVIVKKLEQTYKKIIYKSNTFKVTTL